MLQNFKKVAYGNYLSKITNNKYGENIAKTRLFEGQQLPPNHPSRKIGHTSCENPNKASELKRSTVSLSHTFHTSQYPQ